MWKRTQPCCVASSGGPNPALNSSNVPGLSFRTVWAQSIASLLASRGSASLTGSGAIAQVRHVHGARALHKRRVNGEVLDPLRRRQSMTVAQQAEGLSVQELLEYGPAPASVHQPPPVACSPAQVQTHPARRELRHHGVVAPEQVIGISSKPPDRGVHGHSLA